MYQAALRAGYSWQMCKKAGSKIERKGWIQAVLERWLHREGLSDQELGIETVI
jgi:hypothetical protein